jgi:hypothetical protein
LLAVQGGVLAESGMLGAARLAAINTAGRGKQPVLIIAVSAEARSFTLLLKF